MRGITKTERLSLMLAVLATLLLGAAAAPVTMRAHPVGATSLEDAVPLTPGLDFLAADVSSSRFRKVREVVEEFHMSLQYEKEIISLNNKLLVSADKLKKCNKQLKNFVAETAGSPSSTRR